MRAVYLNQHGDFWVVAFSPAMSFLSNGETADLESWLSDHDLTVEWGYNCIVAHSYIDAVAIYMAFSN